MPYSTEKVCQLFRERGGVLRTSEALAAGVHPRALYEMERSGQVEKLARGLYRLTGLPPMQDPDLAVVAKLVPQGVVCLISALAFYELTTQIPHEVHLALPRTARTPTLQYPPLRVFRFSKPAFEAGIEAHDLDGVTVRVYSREKTLADCFKFRNRLGLDVVIEALRTYRGQRGGRFQEVLEFAQLCRVGKVMRPFLEALA